MTALPPHRTRLSALALIALSALALPGCAVVTAVDVAASVAIGTVGLAADAAIGTARIAGSAIGAAADAVTPGTSDDE
jgi:hypothetical protein